MPLIADFWRHSDFKSLWSKSPMCFKVVIVVDFLTKVRLSVASIMSLLYLLIMFICKNYVLFFFLLDKKETKNQDKTKLPRIVSRRLVFCRATPCSKLRFDMKHLNNFFFNLCIPCIQKSKPESWGESTSCFAKNINFKLQALLT